MFIACKTLNDEMEIYNALLNNDMTGTSNPFGTAGIGICDMKGLEHPVSYDEEKGQFNRFTKAFSILLAHSVSRAVSEAGGHSYDNADCNTPCKKQPDGLLITIHFLEDWLPILRL